MGFGSRLWLPNLLCLAAVITAHFLVKAGQPEGQVASCHLRPVLGGDPRPAPRSSVSHTSGTAPRFGMPEGRAGDGEANGCESASPGLLPGPRYASGSAPGPAQPRPRSGLRERKFLRGRGGAGAVREAELDHGASGDLDPQEGGGLAERWVGPGQCWA